MPPPQDFLLLLQPRPLANAEEINADKEFADGILDELRKLGKY
jgi:hypothetical protein